uniref:Fibrinogen C-terminal domain-containing protein n=1 Tax=Anopheles quadriannulatus TaxID=34691 RepID=A0A182WWR6_ANOQN
MASSRGFVICVCVLQLGVSIKGWLNTDMNVGMPLHTVASAAESTINAAQMELQMIDLKLHIDQSLEYLASKFEIMLERVLLETSAFCERELKHDISTWISALLPKRKDGMECEDLRDDIKDILHGQQQVVDQLANVSSSREIKVARLEHQLRAAAHGSEEHLNGRYLIGKHSYRGGIIWHTFRGSFESLQATRMMVRPLEKIDHDGKHRIIEV